MFLVKIKVHLNRRTFVIVGEQSWGSGELAFPQCVLRFPHARHKWSQFTVSLLVLYSAPRGFSMGTSVFPSPYKTTFDLILLYLELI